MHYVYILKNAKGEKYIGTTQDLKSRLLEHNSGETKTTKNNGVYKIIWYCVFIEKSRAYEFEKYLKSSSGYAFTNKHLVWFMQQTNKKAPNVKSGSFGC